MNSNRPSCEVCGSNERPLRCAQCKKVWYCNTQHQSMDWPNHRKFCQEERKRLQQEDDIQRLQLQQPTTSSNDTACLDFDTEFPDFDALLDDNNYKIPDDIDLEKLLTEITSEVMVPDQQQVQSPQYTSFHMSGSGGEYLPTEIPPFALWVPLFLYGGVVAGVECVWFEEQKVKVLRSGWLIVFRFYCN